MEENAFIATLISSCIAFAIFLIVLAYLACKWEYKRQQKFFNKHGYYQFAWRKPITNQPKKFGFLQPLWADNFQIMAENIKKLKEDQEMLLKKTRQEINGLHIQVEQLKKQISDLKSEK